MQVKRWRSDIMIIQQETVFVLGAGTSRPFNYPIGSELKVELCDVNSLQIAKLLTDTDGNQQEVEQRINKFKEHFRKSGLDSIDLFLKRNPNFTTLGKQLIAYVLLPKEKEDFLFDLNSEKNWYRFLLTNTLDSTFENIDQHKIHFITFNYDRSLEHYLFTSLCESYFSQKNEDEYAKK